MQPTDPRFTGQRWETALGLYDYRARFYDLTMGRFLQLDPVMSDSKDLRHGTNMFLLTPIPHNPGDHLKLRIRTP